MDPAFFSGSYKNLRGLYDPCGGLQIRNVVSSIHCRFLLDFQGKLA